MMIKINKPIALLLLILLFPIVMPLKFIGWLRGERKKVYANTAEIDPMTYTGEKPVIVSVWATWAAVWKITDQLIDGVKARYSGKCEFIYIEEARAVKEKYRVDVLPAVLVFHHGKEVGRFINMIRDDDLKQLIDGLVKSEAGPSTLPSPD